MSPDVSMCQTTRNTNTLNAFFKFFPHLHFSSITKSPLHRLYWATFPALRHLFFFEAGFKN